jgi:hypothetical protein
VRGLLKILIVLLIAAALPLRGYAAVAAELCAGHHGGAPAVHAAEHDHDSTHETVGHDGEHPSSLSICSHCASCSVGSSLAPDSAHPVPAFITGADRIPFLDVRKSGYVPDHPDRPPLVS